MLLLNQIPGSMCEEENENSRSNPCQRSFRSSNIREILKYTVKLKELQAHGMHGLIKNTHSLWIIFDNCLDTRFSNSKHLELCILEVRNELYYCNKAHRLKAISTLSFYVIIGRFITQLGSVLQDSLRNLPLFWSVFFFLFWKWKKKKSISNKL